MSDGISSHAQTIRSTSEIVAALINNKCISTDEESAKAIKTIKDAFNAK